MRKRFVSIAMLAVSIPALGLASFGAVHAESVSPDPQVVIPASFHPSTSLPGADDPAGHDANDDRVVGSATITQPSTVAVTTQTSVRHSDDVVGDDVGDDRVTTTAPTAAAVMTAPSATRSSTATSGDGSSGRHSGGADDPAGHR